MDPSVLVKKVVYFDGASVTVAESEISTTVQSFSLTKHGEDTHA